MRILSNPINTAKVANGVAIRVYRIRILLVSNLIGPVKNPIASHPDLKQSTSESGDA
jgi:DUF1365 family protein